MKNLKFCKGLLLLFLSYFITVSCQPGTNTIVPDEGVLEDHYNEECEKEMSSWLNYLCSSECMGRYVGTEGSRKASDYIIAQLKAMGYEPSIQEFKMANVTMRNILVTISGTKDSCIVIGAHYDGQYPSTDDKHYPAANDNASGVVTLLRIAKDLSVKRVNGLYNLRICFWDGEENTLGKVFKGSDYYVQNCPELSLIKYYYNIDSVGHDHDRSYRIYYYGEWLEQRVIPFIQNSYPLYFTEVAFRDKGEGSSDYVPFSKRGVPILNIGNVHPTDCGYHYHSVTDTPDAISIPLLSTMADIAEKVMLL